MEPIKEGASGAFYHVAVADGKVRPYTKTRVCMDYEV